MLSGRRDLAGYVKTLTALAMMRPSNAAETIECSGMLSLAQCASGITSVGLNADAFVKLRYR
jgi:hypothetical protein